jgi:hypothetical protein
MRTAWSTRSLRIGLAAGVLSLTACGLQNSKDEAIHNSLHEMATLESHQNLVNTLKSRKAPLPLNDVMAQADSYQLSENLISQLKEIPEWETMGISMPLEEIDMGSEGELVFLFVPDENENELEELKGFDRQGQEITLATDRIPDYQVVTLSHLEDRVGAPSLDVDMPNRFYPAVGGNQLADDTGTTYENAHMLERIRFADVHEPWFKGAAEVYLIVTFFDKSGTGNSEIVELPNVDKADQDYYVRKIIHGWPKNKYQIVDLGFFEQDSNYNYRQLTEIVVTAASTVTAMVLDPSGTSAAVASLVSKVLLQVTKALPESFWTDDDDFMDSINTVEKYAGENGDLRFGVGSNVDVDLTLYQLKYNDE